MKVQEILDIEQYLENEVHAKAPQDAHYVFDCDGTLITGDVCSHVSWGVLKEGVHHPEHFLEELKHFTDDHRSLDYHTYAKFRDHVHEQKGTDFVYNWECFVQAGSSPEELVGTAKKFIAEGLKQSTIQFTNPIAKLAKKVSHQAWVVSGSPKTNVVAVAEHLGIHHDRVLGTLLEVEQNVVLPKFAGRGLVWEKVKELVLKDQNVHAPYFVAGDTIGDWHMFEMASDWAWVILWDDLRFRGRQTRQLVEERILKGAWTIPERCGYWEISWPNQKKRWVIEIKRHENI